MAAANSKIELCANGPIIIGTEAVLDGKTIEPGAALCRCGQSQNKPYCDGSHNGAGFNDPGDVTAKTNDDTAVQAPIEIKVAKNGPLICTGTFTVHSADGTTEHATNRAALCRCGNSANKPFCDGTHSKVGFEAD